MDVKQLLKNYVYGSAHKWQLSTVQVLTFVKVNDVEVM
jgi:hypothetical protein